MCSMQCVTDGCFFVLAWSLLRAKSEDDASEEMEQPNQNGASRTNTKNRNGKIRIRSLAAGRRWTAISTDTTSNLQSWQSIQCFDPTTTKQKYTLVVDVATGRTGTLIDNPLVVSGNGTCKVS